MNLTQIRGHHGRNISGVNHRQKIFLWHRLEDVLCIVWLEQVLRHFFS